MDEFRLLVNQCLRHALSLRVTSRGSLSRYARTHALEARVTGKIGLTAAEVATSLASGHRRRLREGFPCRVPYVLTPFVRIPSSAFHLDLDTGRLRLSLRRGEWTSLSVPVSSYHRRVLAEPGRRITQVHIGLHQVAVVYAQATPERYSPRSFVALDTNESSLDGVRVTPEGASFVRLLFPEIRAIQFRHMGRRQYLGRKKAHDRRVARHLLGREGRRERHRIRTRLHDLTRSLIDRLTEQKATLVLEDLKGILTPRRGGRAFGRGTRFRSPYFRRSPLLLAARRVAPPTRLQGPGSGCSHNLGRSLSHVTNLPEMW